MQNQLSLEKISVSYSGKEIIKDFTWIFKSQGVTVLLGRSGCGKSTLIKAIAGLVEHQGAINNNTKEQSIVFQEPRLIPWLTVSENILQFTQLKKQFISKQKIEQILSDVGLTEAKNLYPHQLSGGMKMRTALARALIVKTRLLLLDEPFSALDEPTRYQLGQLLLKLKDQFAVTIIMVSHQIEESLALADEVILIDHGKIKNSYSLKNIKNNIPYYENIELMKIAQNLRNNYLEATL